MAKQYAPRCCNCSSYKPGASMMATPDTRPPLLPVNVAGIPASMLDTPRWAPWAAKWDEKKKKYGKIPYRADRITSGLSTKSERNWSSFHVAMAAYLQNPDKFAGVGYLITGKKVAGSAADVFEPAALVGVDLDHCRDPATGEIAPWAAEVIAKLDSYTEASPTGTGLRVMVDATLPQDWVNHERGIEMYGGTAARFVTITGQQVLGSRGDVRAPAPGVLENFAARWRKVATTAQVLDLHLPALLGDDELPDLADLDIPPHAKNFLLEGVSPGQDRSRALFATSIALNQAGLPRDVILSILEANEYAMEIALDHRRQDYDKALRYLWKDHCGAGAARAEGFRQLDLDQFDDARSEDELAADYAELIGGTPDNIPTQTGIGDPMEDFDDLTLGEAPPGVRSMAAVKMPRFTPQRPDAFLLHTPPAWIIKSFLPQAGLAVVYGASGAGKTFFVLDVAGAVARGSEWRGLKVAKGRVVYIVAEGSNGFRSRLTAYCRANGVNPADLDILVIADVPNFLDKADIKLLIEAIKKVGPVSVIVVDTYARVMAGGNENDAKDTGQAVAHCDALHRIFKALVVLVHHSGKDASKGARGSGALRAAADLEIEVGITPVTKYRSATVTKMKDGEEGAEFAFRLLEVELAHDEDGFPITSCVVEARDKVSGPARGPAVKLTERQQIVLRVLDQYADMDDGGVHWEDLKRQSAAEFTLKEGAKSDNRVRDADREIEALVKMNVLNEIEGGNLIRVQHA